MGVCAAMLTLLFCVPSVRLCFLSLDADTVAAGRQSGRSTLCLYTERRTIYDRSFLPLCADKAEYYISVAPTAHSYTTLSALLGEDSLETAFRRLREKQPFCIRTDEPMQGAGLTAVRRRARYGLAAHVIGYLNGEGHGICGIERDFDDLLYTGARAEAIYTADAVGGILAGIAPRIDLPDVGTDGVVLTLDRDIQRIAEAAMAPIEAGAAVVLEVDSGEICALVSRPDFDAREIDSYLDDAAAPLLNRALTNYNVGSVFKPIFAACALENGLDENFTVECTGSAEIGGHTFACHKKGGHGRVNLQTAIAESCNVFFYTLSARVKPDLVLDMLERASAMTADQLSDSIIAPGGVFARRQDLSAPAARANFSIGQGDLMLSPVKIAALYGMLARGGEYLPPRLIRGVFDGGYTPYPTAQPRRVVSVAACDTIKGCLRETITRGTGMAAAPDRTTAAGKTATAETGWLENGRAVDQAWFAGYFPAEQPRYVIVILCENGSSGAVDCAPVFKEIADGITAHEKL